MLHKTSSTLLALLLATSSQVSIAVEADDVVCTECVDATDIAPGAVLQNRIADGAVSTSKIRDGAVTRRKFADGAVNTDKLQNSAVTSVKIANGAVIGGKLSINAVTTDKLAPGAVNASKIQALAVTAGKLQNDAVVTSKIADGAVTATKLDPALLAALSTLTTTYDMPVVTATQQVYSLKGDFTTGGGATVCQTDGADTEVRDIVRTDLGGGITQIQLTRQRFAGGPTGTPCHYQVITMITDDAHLQLIERKKYNNTGTTLIQTDSTDYNASTCDDCGIIQRANGMTEIVKPELWGGDSTRNDGVNPAEDGVYLGRTTLVEGNFSKSVTAGSFNNCKEYAHERASQHFGYFTRTSTICPTAGRIYTSRVNNNSGGSVTSQIWELVSYTAP